jgi:hypothetical protein
MSERGIFGLTKPPAAKAEKEFLVSNAVLLSGRQVVSLAVLAAAFVIAAPRVWKVFEPVPREADYRLPYALSNDYWLWERLARDAVERFDTLVLGDSVVWGQYVSRDATLPHWLDQRAGGPRFANLGVDGMHPAALAGLIRYHGAAITGKKLILHCNPLWMSSAKADLTDEKEFHFNHPGLVPQFSPSIDCYVEETSNRLGWVVRRYVPFLGWIGHIQAAYIDGMGVPEWTLEHPTSIPIEGFRRGLPPSDDGPRHKPVPWTEAGIGKQDFAWVALESSFQWRSFREALEVLLERRNRVTVIVGPFNEHMLSETGRQGYEKIREGIAAWLSEHGVDHDAPPALPSDLYADASHPLAEGYRRLAERIYPLISSK